MHDVLTMKLKLECSIGYTREKIKVLEARIAGPGAICFTRKTMTIKEIKVSNGAKDLRTGYGFSER